MSRTSKPSTFAGIDVGGKELVVALVRGRDKPLTLTIPNTPEGHKTVIRALRKRAGTARVVLEATGAFHLDLALALSKSAGVELMVANPLAARRFAQAQMRRAKTDRVDAAVLLEFAQRMPLERWTAPEGPKLNLRTITRHLASLIADQTALKNRLAASRTTNTTPAFVIADLEEQLASIAARIEKCQAEARRLADAEPDLQQALTSLMSAPGIGERSALLLLGELGVLDTTMTPDQVVGHAGLDPRPVQSGMRGNSPMARKISKVGNARIRAALYMVALSASRGTGPVAAFYARLKEKKKPAFVAHVAVMRRMLRVAWVLLVRKVTWDGSMFAPRLHAREQTIPSPAP